MAEVFGVVASGVGVTSFAIQIADSMMKLKDFWDSVKEAPEEIIFVLEELETYTALLAEIQLQTDANDLPSISAAAITKSTALCQKSLDTLLVAVKEAENHIAAKKRRASVKYVLKKDVMTRNRMRLESARNLLAFSYNVYCGASSKYQIELQQVSIELHRKSKYLQITASQNPDGTNSLVLKTTPEPNSSANVSEHLSIQKATGDDDIFQQALSLVPLRTTWAEYFAGSVAYRKGVLKQKKLGGDSVDGKEYMWQFRIRFPSWLKAQIWDVHVVQAQSGWTNCFKVYNTVPFGSLQFHYAQSDQGKLLRDQFLTGRPHLLILMISETLFLYSPIDSLYIPGLSFNHDCAEAFDLVLKHTESSSTDDDIHDEVWRGELYLELGDLPEVLLQKFVDLYNIRNTIPLGRRLEIARILVKNSIPDTDNDLDEAIRKLYLILGNDCFDLEGLEISIPYHLEGLVNCSTRLLAYGLGCQHQEALNLARKILKMTIEPNIDIPEPERLTNAIKVFYDALLGTPFSSFAPSDSEKALIMWLTELFTVGLDLERYGEQQKSRKVMLRFPHNKRLPYLGQAEAIVVYGPYPTDWKFYWSTPMDEFSGAFWCMIEKSFGAPMPGSWKEDRWRRSEVNWRESGIYHWWESEDWNDWTLGFI